MYQLYILSLKMKSRLKRIVRLSVKYLVKMMHANKSCQFWDDKYDEIMSKVASIPLDQRPTAFYGDMQTLTVYYYANEFVHR
jgi:hypothetical protein